MTATGFTYDGITSGDMEVVICCFDGDNEISATGSHVEVSTVKAPGSNKWLKTGAAYNEPLSFTFSLCKNPYRKQQEEMYFEAEEQAEIIRWLAGKDYHFLSFDQDDGFENIEYNCVMTLEKKQISGNTIGFTATVTCDAPFGYTKERTAFVNGKKDCIFDTSDEIGYIIPTTILTVTGDAAANKTDVEIYNDNTKETTRISNCTKGETITLTDMMRIRTDSPTHTTLYDDFNWVFPKLQNSRHSNVNRFTLKNCTLEMKWREIRKAVV